MLFVVFCVIFSELKNNLKTTEELQNKNKKLNNKIKQLKTTIKYVKYSKS